AEAAPPAEAPADTTAPRPLDFSRLFDEAFERLDHERGSDNLVSLVELRRQVGVDRQTFDSEGQAPAAPGRHRARGAQGRHGISAEDRDAGMDEGGTLLLYVSRREP